MASWIYLLHRISLIMRSRLCWPVATQQFYRMRYAPFDFLHSSNYFASFCWFSLHISSYILITKASPSIRNNGHTISLSKPQRQQHPNSRRRRRTARARNLQRRSRHNGHHQPRKTSSRLTPSTIRVCSIVAACSIAASHGAHGI